MAEKNEEQRAAESEMAGSRDAQKALGRSEVKAKIPTMRYPTRGKGRKPTRG